MLELLNDAGSPVVHSKSVFFYRKRNEERGTYGALAHAAVELFSKYGATHGATLASTSKDRISMLGSH